MSHKKSIVFVLALLLLLSPFVYCGIRLHQTLPDHLAVAKGAECSINIGSLVSSNLKPSGNGSAVSAGGSALASEEDGNLTLFTEVAGKYDIELKFLGVLPLKTMSVDVIDADTVIPSGETIGIKIHTDGVLLVALSSVETENGETYAPAKDAGLQVGDTITKIDGIAITDSDHFSSLVDERRSDSFTLEYERGGEVQSVQLAAVFSEGHYKIGAWIRDSTAGIGTMTFVKPDTGVYASLGHGISDVDTGQLLTVSQGSITNCTVSSVEPGKKGTPGELRGVFADEDIGVIVENSQLGVYGYCDPTKVSKAEPVKIGTRFEVKEGSAQILSSIDGGEPQAYDVEIEKVMTNSTDAKGMIIHVVDERLIEKTGGIVQGMSGSPILQDGKLIGAVTHVFVNDPTRGYGIFVELMMDEAQGLKTE